MKDNNKIGRQRLSTAIGELVKTSRERKGWSRYRLEKEAGITAVHVKGIEDGALSMRVDTINKLCRTLNLVVYLPMD